MNLNSKLDSETLRERFFNAVGDDFRRGASVHKLLSVSLRRGVWDDCKNQLSELGAQEQIRKWIQRTKDSQGRRIYHSLPSLDSQGNEMQIYKPVALFTLEDYKVKLSDYEKSLSDHLAVYLDLVSQAEERYHYKHRIPAEIRAYIDTVSKVCAAKRRNINGNGKAHVKGNVNKGGKAVAEGRLVNR